MDTRDLGRIDEPLLVFGGPYGNLQATRALLVEAERRGIPRRRLVCTGDLVAYCADPRATVDLIRSAGVAVVMGNCEESVGADAEDCGCGFAEGSRCDLLSAQWYQYCLGALDAETKTWMRRLPRRIRFTMAGRRLTVIHGGVGEINRFVFPSTATAEKAGELDASGADGVIAGHSGLPFTEIIDDRLWHNAGVIGLPANDATPRVWYSVLTPSGRGILVEHYALDYDHGAAARAMRDAGLAPDYAEALETGLWPNDEIMPKDDRRTRGRRLSPTSPVWENGRSAERARMTVDLSLGHAK